MKKRQEWRQKAALPTMLLKKAGAANSPSDKDSSSDKADKNSLDYYFDRELISGKF